MIPYGRQDINASDIDAVVRTLKSDFLTQGPIVPLFEESVVNYCGAQYGVAVNSATSALHIACLALGIGRGDIVWTSPITFVASANCAIYCGAEVDFVDIDLATGNLSAAKLAEKLSEASKTGKLPKAVIPVHLSGRCCDMAEIFSLSKSYGFKIIEDASHAIGGRYQDAFIGGCNYSDITVFSFHPVKIITTAEGGMCLTKDKALYNSLKLLRSHGITRDVEEMMSSTNDSPWYYEQITLGYNYRMTDLQAALGVSQIKRLSHFVERRNEIAAIYDEFLEKLPLNIPSRSSDVYSSYHLYSIQLHLDRLSKTRLQIFNLLRQREIGVNVHYIPVHTQPYFSRMGHLPQDFPNAIDYYSKTISLPIFPGLKGDQQKYIIDAIYEVLD